MNKPERAGKRMENKIYFKDPDIDFWLQAFTLGYSAYGGATIGEVFYAASRIDEKDLETWSREWTALASLVEEQAVESLHKSHTISARQAFLRATTYYRAASVSLRYADPRFKEVTHKVRSCFENFARLFDPLIERIQIPYEGSFLTGYFMKAADNTEKKPTYIPVGGGETFAEDLYFWGGAAGHMRGYNVLLIDLPGQGTTPFDGLHHRHDTEVPMKCVVDYLVSRPDVDSEKIIASGVSLGGYLVLRAVSFEQRIRACALSTPIVDWHQALVDAMPAALRVAPGLVAGTVTKLVGIFAPAQLIAFEKFFEWQTGAKNLGEALEKFKSFKVDVERVTCPTLCMVGEGEDQTFKTQTQLCYERLHSPKKLLSFSKEQGADAHCQANNLQYAHERMFNWFDEILAKEYSL